MQSAPGITPALVERIVASRPDLTKADIKEVGFSASGVDLPVGNKSHYSYVCMENEGRKAEVL